MLRDRSNDEDAQQIQHEVGEEDKSRNVAVDTTTTQKQKHDASHCTSNMDERTIKNRENYISGLADEIIKKGAEDFIE